MVWASGAVFVVVAGVMAWQEASLVFWLSVLLGGSMLLWALVRNPVNGVRGTKDHLILSPWYKPRSIPLRDIAAVEYVNWSDSTDMHLLLRSGETVGVSSLDAPPAHTFRPVLSANGIKVTER